MKVIIYGFESNIQNHSMREICFFLLIFAVMIMLTGRLVERNSIKHRFMQLIRYEKIGRWWCGVWLKVLLFSVAEVAILFGAVGLYELFTDWNYISHGMVMPVVLWIVSFCAIGSFQLLMGLFSRFAQISFLIVVGVEVFSMYGFYLLGNSVDVLPGSYIMLQRTTIMDGVMSMPAILVIEAVFILMVGIFGHRLYRRSSC